MNNKIKGCGKIIKPFHCYCGDWSLKHHEYYYCEECSGTGKPEIRADNISSCGKNDNL